MQKLIRTGQAGTVESNDILITVAPAEAGTGLVIELTSPVMKQYGQQIRAVITGVLSQYQVRDARVHANDKGALDCSIQARVEAALLRALSEEGIA